MASEPGRRPPEDRGIPVPQTDRSFWFHFALGGNQVKANPKAAVTEYGGRGEKCARNPRRWVVATSFRQMDEDTLSGRHLLTQWKRLPFIAILGPKEITERRLWFGGLLHEPLHRYDTRKQRRREVFFLLSLRFRSVYVSCMTPSSEQAHTHSHKKETNDTNLYAARRRQLFFFPHIVKVIHARPLSLDEEGRVVTSKDPVKRTCPDAELRIRSIPFSGVTVGTLN